MRTRLARIGNSRGLRIPELLLLESRLEEEVDIVKEAQVVLDQLRTVDQVRLSEKLGPLDDTTARRVLAEMFSP